MKTRRSFQAAAIAAALAMGLAACGGSSGGGGTSTGTTSSKAAYNAATTAVFNPSTKKGGTIRMANAGDWDSLDPADTYYGYSWNFIRLYGRSLVMFKPGPGAEGTTLVPDLAESLGVATDNAKTWTYKLRKGVKFEDGTPITSKDVKYGVERSLDKTTFPDGPTYMGDFLDTQGYTTPYKDTTPGKLGLKAIDTPDDQTIVFHLKKPFSGFDYFTMQPSTIPVPVAKDTGAKYKEHVVSSGPYMFGTNNLGKNFTLVRNPNWDPATDPYRKALPDKYEVALNVNADDIDNRLIAGDLDMDVVGTGVQSAAQGRILGDPSLKANADSAAIARLWYTSINPKVKPLDNIDCRKAVEYASDHEGYQRAYGGPAGGDIATNLMPPLVPGAQKVDLYNFEKSPTGDIAAAKAALTKCGKPNGFSTNMSYRAERPKEKATAEALQQSLAKVGIKLTLKPFPQKDYFALYAGKPSYRNGPAQLGLSTNGWGADWPDGFGFLQQIVDSRVIRDTGGSSNLSVIDPKVDQMLDNALLELDLKKREGLWGAIDKQVMEDAVILPGIWARGLLYRSKNLTNVFISNGFQMYDYLALGVK
ncbi:MAG: peptide/nickel transport system substrate-binding protein [Actinomycetota bacterium]|jgi:peptide/nickel transport system substrate-binding protein|nr:peptide/nickel transport system substrate-binding protein [Actinomycetota bacterium]